MLKRPGCRAYILPRLRCDDPSSGTLRSWTKSAWKERIALFAASARRMIAAALACAADASSAAGSAAGVIGSLQALEAIKLLLGIGDSLSGRLLAYDSLEQSLRTFKVNRDPSCPACSLDPSDIVIAEYDEYCMPHPKQAPASA